MVTRNLFVVANLLVKMEFLLVKDFVSHVVSFYLWNMKLPREFVVMSVSFSALKF